MNIKDWFLLGLTSLTSLKSKGLSRVLSNNTVRKHSPLFMVQLSHPYMTIEKTIAWTIQTFVGKVMPLLFNTLSRFVIAFLSRSKHLLISWLQSLSTVILESKKINPVTVSPSLCHEVMGPDVMIFLLERWILCQISHFSLSRSSRGSLVPFTFCH